MNKKILSLLIVLLCGFSFAACEKDETWIRPQHNTPLQPDNGKSETPHEDEDVPAKVQLTLAGGHFHGVAFCQGHALQKGGAAHHLCARRQPMEVGRRQ